MDDFGVLPIVIHMAEKIKTLFSICRTNTIYKNLDQQFTKNEQ